MRSSVRSGGQQAQLCLELEVIKIDRLRDELSSAE
jgi:hypothetical protein